jgi:hypothetical protein
MPLMNGSPNDANCVADHDKDQLLTLLNLPPPQAQFTNTQIDDHHTKSPNSFDSNIIKKEDDEDHSRLPVVTTTNETESQEEEHANQESDKSDI